MTSTLDPQNLHRACQSQHEAERTQAYQQLGEILLRNALSRLHSKPELHSHAQECTQEALVAIWNKLEAGLGPDQPQQFLSWCAAIVIHKVYDELRRLGYAIGSGGIDQAETTSPLPPRRTKRVPQSKQESLEQLMDHEDGATVPWAERIADPQVVDPESNVLIQEEVADLIVAIRHHPRLSDDSK